MKITTKILATTLATLLLASCAEEVNNLSSQDGRIRFAVTMADSEFPTTRGVMINDVSAMTTTGFGISGYRYTPPATATTANFIYNAHVAYEHQEWVLKDTEYYLPGANDKLDFYAYFPYGNSDVQVETQNTSGPQQIIYSVNSNVANQADLITASAANVTFNPNMTTGLVPLTFKHELTAVKLVLGNNVIPGYVKSISFENIQTDGHLTVHHGLVPSTWNFAGHARGSVTLDFGNPGFSTTADTKELNAGTQTLLMIPQSFSDDSQLLKVEIDDGSGDTRFLRYQLKTDVEWKAGTVVTYHINTSSINFLHPTFVYPPAWGTDAFTLKTAYEVNDKVGVYSVDESGKVVEANVPYTYDGTTWAVPTGVSHLYNPTYRYYAYYPYRSDVATIGGHTVGDVIPATATEDDFFESLRNQWPVPDDQGTKEKLLACDLQTSMISNPASPSLSLNMKHMMGLAGIVLQSKNVTASIKYYYGNGANKGQLYTTQTGQTVPMSASSNFDTYIPLYDNGAYYYVVNGETDHRTFSATATAGSEWAENFTTNIPSGSNRLYSVALKSGTQSNGFTYKGYYYVYTGTTASLPIEESGTYRFEVWGAQGGNTSGKDGWGTSRNNYGGKGGYSIGYKALNQGEEIFICVGGAGTSKSTQGRTAAQGGYNGGGNSGIPADARAISGGGGGGATHIAKVDGELRNVPSQYVFLVAGGGGGACGQLNGGYGGGTAPQSVSNKRGNYTAVGGGYQYGLGQNGTNGIGGEWSVEGTAGGGGGWRGGCASTFMSGTHCVCGGAGGSGYIGGVVNGATSNNSRNGHGQALILTPILE